MSYVFRGCGTLFVVDKNSILTGVLSRKDFLRTSIGNQDLNKIPVHMIMTRMPNITYCLKDDTLIDVAKKLMDRQIDSLPVVEERENGFEVIGKNYKNKYYACFSVIS